MADKKAAEELEKLSFEQALEKLEASVQELEDGQLGLGESPAPGPPGARAGRCHTPGRRRKTRPGLPRDHSVGRHSSVLIPSIPGTGRIHAFTPALLQLEF